ncbi:MAG TPA: hypothetical protein V6D05_11980 [Stenomitos sp.]
MGLLVLMAVIVLVPLLLLVTDRLGWTAAYTKGRGRGAASNVLLGMDSLFAPEQRRAAIEYRVDKKDALHEQQAGDDREPS